MRSCCCYCCCWGCLGWSCRWGRWFLCGSLGIFRICCFCFGVWDGKSCLLVDGSWRCRGRNWRLSCWGSCLLKNWRFFHFFLLKSEKIFVCGGEIYCFFGNFHCNRVFGWNCCRDWTLCIWISSLYLCWKKSILRNLKVFLCYFACFCSLFDCSITSRLAETNLDRFKCFNSNQLSTF